MSRKNHNKRGPRRRESSHAPTSHQDVGQIWANLQREKARSNFLIRRVVGFEDVVNAISDGNQKDRAFQLGSFFMNYFRINNKNALPIHEAQDHLGIIGARSEILIEDPEIEFRQSDSGSTYFGLKLPGDVSEQLRTERHQILDTLRQRGDKRFNDRSPSSLTYVQLGQYEDFQLATEYYDIVCEAMRGGVVLGQPEAVEISLRKPPSLQSSF